MSRGEHPVGRRNQVVIVLREENDPWLNTSFGADDADLERSAPPQVVGEGLQEARGEMLDQGQSPMERRRESRQHGDHRSGASRGGADPDDSERRRWWRNRG